ncbi:uncharacterized protein LOC127748883 [Frankliniella occidentalis]|uniref:Uncharacterized protein LOC127748883 n=1 Tax=Frankliniella occidentalis TaxID=133901 RepID=A0A9C6TZR4_FRAOC|nr:uncharacterized protein LOC127748883 [Frankliniella occidentalis]
MCSVKPQISTIVPYIPHIEVQSLENKEAEQAKAMGGAKQFDVRALRVRQRFLHDMCLANDSASGSQRLVFIVFLLWISPLGLSHWIIYSNPQVYISDFNTQYIIF